MQSSNSGGPEIGRRVFVAALSTAGAGLWMPALAATSGRGGGGQRKDEPEEEDVLNSVLVWAQLTSKLVR